MWKNEKKLLEIDCKDAHRCGNLGSFICSKSSMIRTQNKSYSNDIFLLMQNVTLFLFTLITAANIGGFI